MAAVRAEARDEVALGVEDADGVSIEMGLLVIVLKKFGFTLSDQQLETLYFAFEQPSRHGTKRIKLELFDSGETKALEDTYKSIKHKMHGDELVDCAGMFGLRHRRKE